MRGDGIYSPVHTISVSHNLILNQSKGLLLNNTSHILHAPTHAQKNLGDGIFYLNMGLPESNIKH